VPHAVACELFGEPDRRGGTARDSLLSALSQDWGRSGPASAVGVTLGVSSEGEGWRYAHWIVARARDQGVRAVRCAGTVWTRERGDWVRDEAAEGARGAGSLVAEVYD